MSGVRFENCLSSSIDDEDAKVESIVRQNTRTVDITEVPKKYFTLSSRILIVAGLYQLSDIDHGSVSRVLFSLWFWFLYIFVGILNPVTKAIALIYHTELDDLTDNISFLVNHMMCLFKIALFIFKQNDLIRLVKTIEGEKFRHEDCKTFSAKKLISKAVRLSQLVYFVFSVFVTGMMINSSLGAIPERSEENVHVNGTIESGEFLQRQRVLPFHSWYPYSTKISPNYELTYVYQMCALFYTAQMAIALDIIVVTFMIHIRNVEIICLDITPSGHLSCNSYVDYLGNRWSQKPPADTNLPVHLSLVQLEILSHNLRYVIPHAKIRRNDHSASGNSFIKTVESLLDKYVEHHKDILRLSEDIGAIFGAQLLLQFVCSSLAICTILWQVYKVPVMSTKFGSMLSYLGAAIFQLSFYCWFGNEMMLESLSVAKAAWDSRWYKLLSKRCCHSVGMIILRSQRVIVMTAGGFIDLTLETFVKILRAAYSCFAVLKNMDN